MLRDVLRGAAAGAAGTTALNAAAYLDMTVRGRPESETPRKTAQALAAKAELVIPGEGAVADNRASALGALSGIGAGIGVGAALGVARGLGVRVPMWAGVVAASVGALAGTNGPMTVLGVTDPREWSAVDWVSDIVPHVAYGVVTAAAFDAMG